MASAMATATLAGVVFGEVKVMLYGVVHVTDEYGFTAAGVGCGMGRMG